MEVALFDISYHVLVVCHCNYTYVSYSFQVLWYWRILWQWVPVLDVSVGVQVMCRDVDTVKVIPLQKTELSYKLLSISWLNSRTMTLIDVTERAHVLDVRSEEEVEIVDLSDVKLVYGSSFYKSLATGGNVSPALACAGERACYQAVVPSGGQVILLGTKAIHVLILRTWSERIDLLVRHDRYSDALSLARSFYDGSARAVIGLSGSPQRRQEQVAERIMQLLSQYVTLSMTKLCPSHGKLEELETYFQVGRPWVYVRHHHRCILLMLVHIST